MLNLTFGRHERITPDLLEVAAMIVSDIAQKYRCSIETLAHGGSSDYGDWVAIGISGNNTATALQCAETFAQRITQFGAIVIEDEPDRRPEP